MNKATRKAVIAGNWKMNMTPSQAKETVEKTAALVKGKDGCDIVLCVPFVDIAPAVEAAKDTNIKIGAQNVHFAESGGGVPLWKSVLHRGLMLKKSGIVGFCGGRRSISHSIVTFIW